MNNKTKNASVLTDLTDILHALVGLKDVIVLAYERNGPDVFLLVEQELTKKRRRCPECHHPGVVKERPIITYVDLPAFGTPMRLRWKKHRMTCRNTQCQQGSWTVSDHRIAAKSCVLTTRAAKWATKQVGEGRTIQDVADELACDWHTMQTAVTTYGTALLFADKKRLNKTSAIGLDETRFCKGTHHAYGEYVTTIADVEHHQIIDLVETREMTAVAAWLDKQPKAWKQRIKYGALDMSNTYAAVFSVVLPQALQVVDSFHLVQLANRALDAIRRRVQIEQTSHRGRKDDPLYRARRVLLMGEEKLDEKGTERLNDLLALGDPNGEVAIAYRCKERIRDFYRAPDLESATAILDDLANRCTNDAMPPELQTFGRTLKKWFTKICNYHIAKVSNGPTEALNNLIKRVKRVAYGFRNFQNYRVRVLLYAGKPNWRVLDSIVVQ